MGDNEKASLRDIQELSLCLENRSFVDYFNTFLCLPVFGQHVFYNYLDTEFKFEPPIKQRRHLYLDRLEILAWLCKERLCLFKMSPLFTEYNLCMKLRSTELDLPEFKQTDPNGENSLIFLRNLIGTVTGMMLFRESLRGTNGEHVFRCWKDIEAWKLIKDPVRKLYWKRAIKTKYINQNSNSEVKASVKVLVFKGNLSFSLVHDGEKDEGQLDNSLLNMEVECTDSDEALLHMQSILLNALKKYWLPRHIIHIMKTTPKETLDILKRPAPSDEESAENERRRRCRLTFPTIYQESNISSPATEVFVSKSAGEIPSISPPPVNDETEDKKEDDESDDFDYDDDVSKEIENIGPVDLLSMWGGPARQIEITDSSSASTVSTLTVDSPDVWGRQQTRSRAFSVAKYPRNPIPLELTSFLGGKKRTMVGRIPKTSNRVIWSLASDVLASFPFRTFLQTNEFDLDLQYLSFWQDVRNYLDADDSAVNAIGQSLRRLLAHGILQRYLSKTGEGSHIFSETLKMALFQALTSNNDVSLLCVAQDIVQENLWEPLKLYIEDERKHFLNQVRGRRYNLTIRQRKKMDRLAKRSKSNMAASEYEDPTYFFHCTAMPTDSQTSVSSPALPSTMPRRSALSRPGTSYHVCITEEQMWKATELAVLCCEYGSAMMVPQFPPAVTELVDVLHSDYGSLNVSRVPAVRNEWIRNLINPPKINIETIQVSRKVFLDKIDIPEQKPGDVKENIKPRNRLVMRRNGMILERPTKPKSFIDVLTISIHFDFFKRFMTVHKRILPLMFWKAVEDLKDLSNAKTRHIRVTHIMRSFFGKYAKYGALLDCDEEIIRQIPNMDRVNPGILICAQAAVYRSMERKWYPMYLETFPPESETSSPTNAIHTSLLHKDVSLGFMDVVFNKVKKAKKKQGRFNSKVVRLWRSITRALVEFHRALCSKQEVQLLEMFLKWQVEKEQYSTMHKYPMNPGGSMHPLEKSMMMSNLANNQQTRVVIRNRLIILNRIPADLRFWIEVRKFQDLVDSATSKGNMSSQDTDFLCDKARSVISCYLSSDVPPKVQVNIPNDMANNIINVLAAIGPVRGLFHDAIFLLFPMLYHYYKKFQDEVINGNNSEEYLEMIERSIQDNICSNPHGDEPAPDFNNVSLTDVKKVHHSNIDENLMKIHFSLSDGIVYIYPVPKVQIPSQGGRRMTKHIITTLNEEESPNGNNHNPDDARKHGDKRSDGGKGKGSRHSLHSKDKEKGNKKGKVFITEETESRRLSVVINENDTSERARRLSSLVESLNTERSRKQDEQSKIFSKAMNFNDVVNAAMNEL